MTNPEQLSLEIPPQISGLPKMLHTVKEQNIRKKNITGDHTTTTTTHTHKQIERTLSLLERSGWEFWHWSTQVIER